MIKKIVFVIIIFVLLVFPIKSLCEGLDTYSNYVLVYNLNDNEILYEKNPSDRVSIASLTKIMSVVVALENINNISDKITFPKIKSLYGYSRMDFKYGEELTYEDLLYSAMLPSAADATEGLGILISGSTSDFVKLMNEKAKELNMDDTHFSNTYGKDSSENYSTVNDLLKLMLYALKNEEFYKIFTTKNYTLTNEVEIKNSVLYYSKGKNLNTFLIKGAKTGYTDGAGYCLISIYEEGNVKLLIITTDADYKTGKPLHIMDGINIGNYFLDNYEYKILLNKDEYLGTINILGVNEDIYSDEEIKLFLPKDIDIKKEFSQSNKINSHYKIGDKVGLYVIYYGDDKISKDIVIPNNSKIKLWLFFNNYIRPIYRFTKFVFLK